MILYMLFSIFIVYNLIQKIQIKTIIKNKKLKKLIVKVLVKAFQIRYELSKSKYKKFRWISEKNKKKRKVQISKQTSVVCIVYIHSLFCVLYIFFMCKCIVFD